MVKCIDDSIKHFENVFPDKFHFTLSFEILEPVSWLMFH